MARRVEPQPRGPGGRFAPREPVPSTEPSTAEHGGEHGDPPVLDYPEPPAPSRTRRSTAKKPVRAGKKPARKARPRTEPNTAKPPVPARRSTEASGDRPLGFLDGLAAPLGIARRG